jgi:RimJ/RimL family protein N-acetyltransferase
MPEFPEQITTKRTVLRRIRFGDAAAWKSFNNAIARKTSWPKVPSIVYARNEMLNYEQDWDKGTRYVYAIIDRQTKELIGDFHIKSVRNKRAEYGHALHPNVWGTGITYETLDAVCAAAKRLRIALWGKVEEENIRSWKSLEKYHAKFKGVRTFSIHGERKKMRVYEL